MPRRFKVLINSGAPGDEWTPDPKSGFFGEGAATEKYEKEETKCRQQRKGGVRLVGPNQQTIREYIAGTKQQMHQTPLL